MEIIQFIRDNLGLVLTCISFLFYLLLYIIALIKNTSHKKLEYKQKALDVLEQVPIYIKQAEELIGSGHGDLKKKFVLGSISSLCKILNITIDQVDVDMLIENILATPIKRGGP